MKRFAILLLFLFATAAPAFSQCSPFMGIGAVQFEDNSGQPLTNGALYVFVASTSTQAPSYQDSQCSVLNTNPVTFGLGGRATIWVATSGFFKYVLCSSSTDGPFCSPSDVLFSVDGVPGGATSSGGGGPNFVGIFISQTASPATSGTLRLASGDSTCWRNAAGSANLCWSKSSGDILQWGGGSLQFPEIAAPACGGAGTDCIWADNTARQYREGNFSAECLGGREKHGELTREV